MNKIAFIVFFILILVACDSNKPEEMANGKDSTGATSGITEFKINDDVKVNISKEKTKLVEGKELVAPNSLFDFYPSSIKNIKLEKSSSGETRSGLGRYTTSTGVYVAKGKLIKVRIADYYSKEFFPDYQLFIDLPTQEQGYIVTRLDLKDGYIGYMRWEENYKYGFISLFIKNRFHVIIDIDGFPELKDNYKDLVYKFKFEN